MVSILSRAPEGLSEMLFFGGELIRRRAKVFEKTSSKVAELFAQMLGLGKRGLQVLGIAITVSLVERWRPDTVDWLGRPLLDFLAPLSKMGSFPAVLLIAFIAYLALLSSRLQRRFEQRDSSDPSSRRI